MSLEAAFDALAAWSVTGVTNLALDDVAGPVPETDLPALVARFGGTGGEALMPLGILAEAGRVVVHVEHMLLLSGLGVGLEVERFADAIPVIDAYLEAAALDLDLGGTLLEPLRIADTSAGAIEFYGVLYYGVTFRHRWVLKVAP